MTSAALGACSAGFAAFGMSRGFIVGNRITSLIESQPVSSMAQRSMPMPRPPVGGMPYSRAFMKSVSIMPASSSPLARSSTCFSNLCFWSMGSFSSEKALPISLRQMKSSKRSVSRGSFGLRFASGDTSTGCIVMKVG